jgi:glycosyltransferase involved in cell wall biosynthesis
MACGCHILAHDNPYNRDVLAENSGYFASEAQLAALLKSVPNPDTERSGLENNLAAIRDRYEWNKITNEYESAFYQVLEH